jgi:hypothetical protein
MQHLGPIGTPSSDFIPCLASLPSRANFTSGAVLPFEFRLRDFEMAMQDVYDVFYDVNRGLVDRGLERLR